jgi:hypothetical protein
MGAIARIRRGLVGAVLLLAGCAGQAAPQGPQVWIDAPLDGLSFPVGQLITIQGHAAGPAGIGRIEIWIDGALEIEQDDPPSVGNLAHFDHIWLLERPGDSRIEVVAIGADGTASAPDTITLHVAVVTASPTPVPTTASPTPVPTIATPTLPPTPTRTATPVPRDEQAPAAPAPTSPTGNPTLGCAGQVSLVWNPASDPSGIGEYRVEVQRHSGDNNWQSVSGSPWVGVGGTSLSVPVECGWYYRWRVLAVDGAGNVGSFSSWAAFAVTLG